MKILITAGPTRERIDPVRFITNYSSGKMGYSLAEAAEMAEHKVTLVSGPTNLRTPADVDFVGVESAADMAEAVHDLAPGMDLIIMAAAVADYRPVNIAQEKLKKTEENLVLELERTEDILLTLGKNKPARQVLAGFAAETEKIQENALRKLHEKNLDWIIANSVSGPDSAFGSDHNEVTMYSRDGQTIELERAAKFELATRIIKILTD